MEAEGTDHEALLDTYIRALNLCTQGRPDDLTFGVHMCRGNYRVSSYFSRILRLTVKQGKHFAEGSYARIAIKLFNNLDVDTFYVSILIS